MPVFGYAVKQLHAGIVKELRRRARVGDELLLIKVKIDEAGCRIVEDHIYEDKRLFVLMAVGHGAEGDLHLLFTGILHGAALDPR